FYHLGRIGLLRSFPTRRSSDLAILDRLQGQRESGSIWANLGLWRGLTLAGFATAMALAVVLVTSRPETPIETLVVVLAGQDAKPDRKSTRLNSSHVAISYAVFC